MYSLLGYIICVIKIQYLKFVKKEKDNDLMYVNIGRWLFMEALSGSTFVGRGVKWRSI